MKLLLSAPGSHRCTKPTNPGLYVEPTFMRLVFFFFPDARTGTREDTTHTPTLSYICLGDILVLGKWVLEAVKLGRISKNMNTVGFILSILLIGF